MAGLLVLLAEKAVAEGIGCLDDGVRELVGNVHLFQRVAKVIEDHVEVPVLETLVEELGKGLVQIRQVAPLRSIVFAAQGHGQE